MMKHIEELRLLRDRLHGLIDFQADVALLSIHRDAKKLRRSLGQLNRYRAQRTAS